MPDRRGVKVWVKKDERDLEVQTASYNNNQWVVEFSIGNVVNNNVVIIYGARWVLDLSW